MTLRGGVGFSQIFASGGRGRLVESRQGHVGSVAEINLSSEASSSETHQSCRPETLDPLRDGASCLTPTTSDVGSLSAFPL